MSKWNKTRRDPGRTYQDEQEAKRLRDDMKRIAELVAESAEGNDAAESTYIGIINRLEPEMTKNEERN